MAKARTTPRPIGRVVRREDATQCDSCRRSAKGRPSVCTKTDDGDCYVTPARSARSRHDQRSPAMAGEADGHRGKQGRRPWPRLLGDDSPEWRQSGRKGFHQRSSKGRCQVVCIEIAHQPAVKRRRVQSDTCDWARRWCEEPASRPPTAAPIRPMAADYDQPYRPHRFGQRVHGTAVDLLSMGNAPCRPSRATPVGARQERLPHTPCHQ
jgi:hypothetical protein